MKIALAVRLIEARANLQDGLQGESLGQCAHPRRQSRQIPTLAEFHDEENTPCFLPTILVARQIRMLEIPECEDFLENPRSHFGVLHRVIPKNFQREFIANLHVAELPELERTNRNPKSSASKDDRLPVFAAKRRILSVLLGNGKVVHLLLVAGRHPNAGSQ